MYLRLFSEHVLRRWRATLCPGASTAELAGYLVYESTQGQLVITFSGLVESAWSLLTLGGKLLDSSRDWSYFAVFNFILTFILFWAYKSFLCVYVCAPYVPDIHESQS